MAMEGNHDASNGWPLGLGNMKWRIMAAEEAAPPHPPASRTLPSSGFSSFSSSNLDTLSTESFFPEHSVSLGRLIGIRPSDSQRHHRRISDERSHPNVFVIKGKQNSRGLCAPLLKHVIGKMGRSGSTKKH